MPAAGASGACFDVRAGSGGGGGAANWWSTCFITASRRPSVSALDYLDFRHERLLVEREIGAELGDLGADDGAGAEDQSEGEHHGEKYGGCPCDVQPAQEARQGSQQEAQQDRQRNWDQDVTAEIERGHDHDAHRQGEKAVYAGQGRRRDFAIRNPPRYYVVHLPASRRPHAGRPSSDARAQRLFRMRGNPNRRRFVQAG